MWTKPEVASLALRRDVSQPRNLLLRSLPGYDYERLRPFLDPVPLIPRRVLQHARMPVQHLYFIEEGLVSVLANADEQQAVEVWLIGREGVVGSPAVLGVSASPLKHLVQVGGSALRIGVGDLGQALTDMPRLRRCSSIICMSRCWRACNPRRATCAIRFRSGSHAGCSPPRIAATGQTCR